MVRKCQKNGLKWPGNGPIWSGKCRHQLENDLRYWKWPKIARKWPGNGLKWSELAWNGLKLSEIVPWSNIVQDDPIWSKMVHDGLKWSNMVWNGPRWSKIPKWSKMLEALEKIHFANVRPERRMREGRRKKKTLDHPPHFYGSIFFLCSFLFSLFKSFHVAR